MVTKRKFYGSEKIMLDELTIKDVKKKFIKSEFWDFIFETAYGISKQKAIDKGYISISNDVVNTNADGLIDYINMHIRHKIPITRKGINDFALYIIDSLDVNIELTGMKGIRFQMIVSYLYDLIFESTWQYFR